MNFLGVDVGTTGVRAAIFDANGRRLAEAQEPCAAVAREGGVVEADAEGWWEAAAAACRSLGSDRLGRVRAVGVVGQAPTIVLVDGAGHAVRPAILWLDVRSGEQARRLARDLGRAAEERSGNRMHAYFAGPKAAWLAEQDPGSLEKSSALLQSHAFVVLRLTGEAVCDPSTAMLCAPLFDARAATWWPEGARAVGIDERLLPRLARSDEIMGCVNRVAAEKTGLREGTPVVAGGGDFAASALGAGVIDEGEACLMLGTAGNLLMPTRTPRFDRRLIHSHHVGCERWLALGGTLCGGALEWFRRACAPGVDWQVLESEAASVEVGAGGVVMLPYLQGERTPIWDEKACGVISGLDLTHGRGHVFRALLEGIALGFRDSLSVGQELGVNFGEVIASNGAGKSALFRQILADALELPVSWSPQAAGTLAGAALLGAIGIHAIERDAGIRGFARGSDRWMRHEPDPGASARLRAVFAERKDLYEKNRRG